MDPPQSRRQCPVLHTPSSRKSSLVGHGTPTKICFVGSEGTGCFSLFLSSSFCSSLTEIMANWLNTRDHSKFKPVMNLRANSWPKCTWVNGTLFLRKWTNRRNFSIFSGGTYSVKSILAVESIDRWNGSPSGYRKPASQLQSHHQQCPPMF